MISSSPKLNFNQFPITFILYLVLILGISSCISSELKVSEFEFNYNDQNYIIRSAYCPNDPESCNQLIGNNFIAVDMNQDRIIDNILKGNITLSEAQIIYDYSLDILSKQGKINEINRESKKYLNKENDYNFEMISFFPRSNSPFNEFKIVDNRNNLFNGHANIYVDNNADGTLDELLKGTMTIKDAQEYYSKQIEKGLGNNNLIKMDKFIIVK